MTTAGPIANVREFAEVVGKQRSHFQSGATRSQAARRAALLALRSSIVRHEKNLLAALHADLRKSPPDAWGSEIALPLSEIDFALKHFPRWMKPRRRPAPLLAWPAQASVVAEPLGVSLIIGPWNYPVQLLLMPLVGALAAGNCAVLKPSELTPHTSAALAAMIGEAHPAHHIALVEGDRFTVAALLRERFDAIFFTGGAVGGRAVLAAAAEHLTPVTLELGGKSPCIVCEDAEIDLAAGRIIWGKMLNAGQTCVAPDYVLVHRSRLDELVAALRRAVVEYFGDEPKASPKFGRIVNSRHFDRLCRYLDEGTIIFGGERDADDRYIAPTVLVDPAPQTAVMTDEIFGPILPVIPFEHWSSLLTRFKEQPAPLAAYLFARNRAVQREFMQTMRAGGICINDTVVQLFGKHLPFGGVGASGMGRYHGRASFQCFCYEKTILRCGATIHLPWRNAPGWMTFDRLKKALPFLLRR
jgi:acyl-CoA reductase-like NAD-dependent aldehyde dehydrogenase